MARNKCSNMMCEEPQKARGLCVYHYRRMLYARNSEMVTTLQERCQAGLNDACADCGDTPFGGGLRCLPCFQAKADQRRGEHTSDLPPSPAAYTSGCRCRRCKDAASAQRKAYRKAAA